MSATDIVLEYVCPSLGVIAANLMFSSALRDCRTKVVAGQGLQSLNVRATKWLEALLVSTTTNFLLVACDL